jgi:hypothetical protein
VGTDKAGMIGGRKTKSKGLGGVVVVLECGFGLFSTFFINDTAVGKMLLNIKCLF